jgi:hypothetical protein
MDEMSSAEFRKRYAKLTKPTTVTVNGHPIGQWIPEHSATYVMAQLDDGSHEVFGLTPPPDALTREPAKGDPLFRFNSAPFTPVPKSRRK